MSETIVASDKLESWKEIASWVGKTERTAKRWEQERGLPVHRVPGGGRQVVFAYRHELDAWLAGLSPADIPKNGHTAPNGSIPEPKAIASAPLAATPPTTQRRQIVVSRKNLAYAVGGLLTIMFLAAGFRYADGRFSFHPPQITGQQQLTQNGAAKTGLVTDGKNLYFGQEENGWVALAEMPVDGGSIRILWRPEANVGVVDISPDGRRLAVLARHSVEAERELWIVPLDGGKPYRLGNITAHSAAWVPQGDRIAYAAGTKIYLASANDAATRELGAFTAVPYALHWSEDGKHLRFLLVEAASEKATYWEFASKDGMATTTLRSLPWSMGNLQNWWTRTNRNDAYFFTGLNDRIGNTSIWFLQHGGGWWEPSVQIAQVPLGLQDINSVAYDRKSRRLFILGGPLARNTLVRFDPHTQEFRDILSGVAGLDLDYSRDERWITYIDPGSNDDKLWASRADGSAARQLTFPPGWVQLPRWSPDGTQVAYMLRVPDRPWRIMIQRLDSGERREASEGDDAQGAPTWSPDGKFIYYGGVLCQPTHSCAIHRIDLATGKVQTLPGSQGLFTARCSPDGRHVAALHMERHQLYVFDVQARQWHKLTDGINGVAMNWSADSQYVYVDIVGKDTRIVRIRIADGHQEAVANLQSQDLSAVANADDLTFALAPDDSLILHQRIQAQQIYAYTLSGQ